MSEKRVVDRKVAIALGITCIILAISLTGAIINYTLMISEKDKTISSLNLQVSSLNSQITTLRNTIAQLNAQISNLQSQVDNLNSIVSLKKVEIIEKDKTVNLASYIAGTRSFTYFTPYAGYFVIEITATKPVYIEVYNQKYGYTLRLPKEGTTTNNIFIAPVLPDSTWVMIYKQNWWEEATITFSIRYIY